MSNIGQGFKPKATAARLGPNTVACKCQICNCGKHHCPPDRHLYELTPYEQDALKTNYQQNYTPHPLTRVPKRDDHRPPNDLIFGSGKFDAQTTCQSDFRAPPGGSAKAVKPPSSDPTLITGGNNSRNFTSENRANFAPKPFSMRESYAPTSSHTSQLPFEGSTTTGSDYRAHAGAKPSTPFREQSTLSGKPEDRDFQTEAALKFVAHGNQRRQGFQPTNRSRETLPFEGQSTTSSDYKGISAPPARSFAPQQSHSSGAEDRDFKSLNSLDYQPKGYAVRESYKPQPDRAAAALPFDGATTHKSDFTGARAPRAQLIRPAVGLTDTIGTGVGKPDDRKFISENRGQFDPKAYAARQSYAPTSSHTSQLPFEGSTTTGSDYRAHAGAKPSTPFREQSTLSGKPEDRDFQSESALKYQPHGYQVRESFHPSNRSRVNLPFEGISTTKSDYKPHAREGCPAMELPDYDAPRGSDGHQMWSNANGRWEPAPRR